MTPKKGSKQWGLKETPPDPRDFTLGAITFLPELDALPAEHKIPLTIKNQLGSDFCSAYMSCFMSEPQEGVELEPAWSFAVSKQISGDINTWGQNIRDALKAHVKYGAVEKSQTKMSVQTEAPEVLRDIANWPDYTTSATIHKKQSFFRVSGQYDHFDNARAALYKYNAPIGTGVNFGWPLKTILLASVPANGFGHAVTINGFTTYKGQEVLIVHNSYGPNAGEAGEHYITRDVYNFFVEKYGHWMFVDLSPDDARWYIDHGIALHDNWLVMLSKIAKTGILSIINVARKYV